MLLRFFPCPFLSHGTLPLPRFTERLKRFTFSLILAPLCGVPLRLAPNHLMRLRAVRSKAGFPPHPLHGHLELPITPSKL